MKLKRWVKDLLIFMQIANIMMLSGDCESMITFITSKAIILVFMLLIHKIIYKYTDLYVED